MTERHDLDQQLSAFLREGPTDLPDPSFDTVRDRIEQTRQRAVIGSMGVPDMNKFLAVGLGVAAVVLAGYIGVQLLGGPAPGGPAPVETPSPVESVATEPSAAAAADLPEGPYLFSDEVPITVTIAAPGWSVNDDGALVKDENIESPDGLFVFGPWVGEFSVPADPCEWSSAMSDTPANTVDEIVAALTSQASRDASEPMDVTVDGHAGQTITLHVPEDVGYNAGEFDCDQGNFCTVVSEAGCEIHNPAPGAISDLWIGDFDGEVLIMAGYYYPETSADHVDEMRGILESMTFE